MIIKTTDPIELERGIIAHAVDGKPGMVDIPIYKTGDIDIVGSAMFPAWLAEKFAAIIMEAVNYAKQYC